MLFFRRNAGTWWEMNMDIDLFQLDTCLGRLALQKWLA